jgi:transcriptional regulator with XRE-family HTH domain
MKSPMPDDGHLIRSFLNLALSHPGVLQSPTNAKDGLLRRIRSSKGKSQGDIAKELKLTSQAISSAEGNEADGSIQLKTLARIAEAMGYTLIYTLVPKTSLVEAVGLSAVPPNRESAERAAGRPDNPLVMALVQMIVQAEARQVDLGPLVYEHVYRPVKPGA